MFVCLVIFSFSVELFDISGHWIGVLYDDGIFLTEFSMVAHRSNLIQKGSIWKNNNSNELLSITDVYLGTFQLEHMVELRKHIFSFIRGSNP